MEKIKKFLFVNTGTKQTIIKNTMWLFVGEFGIKFLKLAIFVYAARKLGTTEWGLFSYALALLSFFTIVSDIGLNTVLLKKASLDNEEKQKYISTGLFLKIGLSLISSIALLSLIFFLKNDNLVKSLLPAASVLLFLDTMREFGFSINRATEKMEIEAIIKIVTMMLLVVAGFIFIKIRPVASSLLYAYLFSSALGLLIIYLNLKKYFYKVTTYFDKKLLLPIWIEAWPIGLVAAIGTIMASVDILILGWFSTVEQIGIYSTAQKLIQVLYILPALISTSVLPVFSKYANNDKDKMTDMTKTMVKWSFYVTIPIVILCILIGGPIIIFLFGQQYIASVAIFKIMSAAIIVGAPSAIICSAVFALGKQKILIQFILISLLTNVILCLLFIPRFGIYGAAISVTIAQSIGNLILIKNYYYNNI